MAYRLIFTNQTTSEEVAVEPFVVAPLDLADGVDQVETLGNGMITVRDFNPDTMRSSKPLQWTVTWPAARSGRQDSRTSAEFLSLMRGWRATQDTLRMTGMDFMPLHKEPLRRFTDGVYANKRFSSADPWWDQADTELIYVSGTLQSSSAYVIDYDRGYVTMLTGVGTGLPVQATIARCPQVTIQKINVDVLHGVTPLAYGETVVLRESVPV